MVDNTLLEQVLRLDDDARRELRNAIDESLDRDELDPELAAFLDARIASVAAHTDDRISIDELERQLQAEHIA